MKAHKLLIAGTLTLAIANTTAQGGGVPVLDSSNLTQAVAILLGTGIALGIALASKWVALYAIGGLGLLVLFRSALGRAIALLGMVGLTSVLGTMAIQPDGTGNVTDERITELVREHFDLRPYALIRMLDLVKPIYRKTAAYGHFGRTTRLDTFTWEKTDKVAALTAAVR